MITLFSPAADKRFLIFERFAHSVIFFVQAPTTTEAVWEHLAQQWTQIVRLADGSVQIDRSVYPHPLACIEAMDKTQGEWQIRELPDWAWADPYSEIFCGESEDGPAEVIAECRPLLRKEFPRSRAKAFVWYLRDSRTLVTFYQRRGPWQITVLKRYAWNWDGQQKTIEEWTGTYDELAELIAFPPPRWS